MNSASSGWYVYLIRNRSGALYCGISTDVIRRFREHNASGPRAARALRGKGPLSLEFSQLIGSRSQALKMEYRIKRLPKLMKEAVIARGKLPEPLHSLAKGSC